MLRKLRSSFISGLILLAPLGVTVFVLNFLITKLGTPTRNMIFFFLDKELLSQQWIANTLDVASMLLLLIAITILGWFSNLLIGRFFVRCFDRMVSNMPIVRNIYATVKQIVDTFSQQQKAVFQKAVLCEYPRKDCWVIGFVTSMGKGEVQLKTESELINIFVPTTPNPTSGFLLMIPKEDAVELEMSISDAMKLVISGGAVVPPYPPIKKKTPPVLPVNNNG